MEVVEIQRVDDELVVESRSMAPWPDLSGIASLLVRGQLPEWLRAKGRASGYPERHWARLAGRWVHEVLWSPVLEAAGGPEGSPIFVRCDGEAGVLPLEAAVSPTGWPELMSPGGPDLVRVFGPLQHESWWSPGEAMRVALVDAMGGTFSSVQRAALAELAGALAGDVVEVDPTRDGLEGMGQLRPGMVVLVAHGDGQTVQLGDTTVGNEQLAEWLAASGARLVIASSCRSGASEFDGALARLLVEQGLPAVVACRHEVELQAVAAFVVGLTEGLRSGLTLPGAVRCGRRWVSALGANPLHHAVFSLYASTSSLGPVQASRRGAAAAGPLEVLGLDAGLPFTAHRGPSGATQSPGQLLRPRARFVPLVGRLDAMRMLLRWLDSDDDLAVAAVVGEGGSGKTRLALEIVDRAGSQGWVAGFVDSGRESGDVSRIVGGIVGHPADCLVVVDYAESTPEFVRLFADRAVAALGESPMRRRVRLLLLIRQVPGWRRLDGSPDWLASFGLPDWLLDRPDAVPVIALGGDGGLSSDEAAEVFREATERFTALTQFNPATRRALPATPPAARSPLLLAAAALAAVADPSDPAAMLEPLAAVLRHERAYWRRTSPVSDAVLLDRIVAAAVLCGLGSERRLADRLAAVPDLSDASAERRAGIARWCVSLGIDSEMVQPDRLAETLVGQVLVDCPSLVASLLDGGEPAERDRVIRVLSKMADHCPGTHPTLTALIGPRLPDLAGEAARRSAAGPLAALVGLMPGLGVDVVTAAQQSLPVVPTADAADLRVALARRLHSELVVTSGPVSTASLQAHRDLVSLLDDVGRYHEALSAGQECVEAHRAARGEHHLETLAALRLLAEALGHVGKQEDALPIARRALDLSIDLLGESNPETLRTMGLVVVLMVERGQRHEAVPIAERRFALSQERLGSTHPDTLIAASNLSYALALSGRREDAISLDQFVLERRQAAQGARDPHTLRAMGSLAYSLAELGRHDEALPLQERRLALSSETLGDRHADTLLAMGDLALTLHALGHRERALQLQEYVLAIRQEVLGSRHPATLMAMGGLAHSLAESGGEARAILMREDRLALSRAVLGDRHPDTLVAVYDLLASMDGAGRWADAVPLAEELLAARDSGCEMPPYADLDRVIALLAQAQRELGRLGEAQSVLADDTDRATRPPDGPPSPGSPPSA